MTREARLLSDFNVGVPEYVPAKQIEINMSAIGRIAGWGCMQPDVDIVSYDGPTTPRSAGAVGFNGQGTAVAGGTADPKEAPLGTFSLIYDESESGSKDLPSWWYESRLKTSAHLITGHSRPELTLKLNLPEIQQRLQDRNATMRDPKVWAKEIHAGLGEGLRAAARHHLLGTLPSEFEAMAAMLSFLPVTSAAGNIAVNNPAFSPDSALLFTLGVPLASMMLVPNVVKALCAKRHGLRMREAAYSLIPGFHVDRYLAVAGLTKLHRLARPIKG